MYQVLKHGVVWLTISDWTEERPGSGVEVMVKSSEKWKEEETDDGDVKDNWDDEDEEPRSEPSDSVPKPAASKKSSKVLRQKIVEKEMKERRTMTTEEALADRLYRQKLQEESDLKLAKEAIGITDAAEAIDAAQLSSKEDFDKFRDKLVSKLRVVERSAYYSIFLESTMRDLCASLDVDDLKRISSSLTTLYNEKLKSQKASVEYCLIQSDHFLIQSDHFLTQG